MILSENINTHSQRRKYTVTQFNHIPVFLWCRSVCFVCSLSIYSATMLNAVTRLPICVYKTNRACSYLNTRVTRYCECCSLQTTATVVWQPVCSSLIVHFTNGTSDKHGCLSAAPCSFQWRGSRQTAELVCLKPKVWKAVCSSASLSGEMVHSLFFFKESVTL